LAPQIPNAGSAPAYWTLTRLLLEQIIMITSKNISVQLLLWFKLQSFIHYCF